MRDLLEGIPGVGPSIAKDLRDLGVRSVADLKRRDPERMYEVMNRKRGARQDPCLLYVFRCAVYFARTPAPDPELLKWWSWKGRSLPRRRRTGVAPVGRRVAGVEGVGPQGNC
jgi:hypothetical protein